jgi:selenobiotic family peptide radical SAM maturase
MKIQVDNCYPMCKRILGPIAWERILRRLDTAGDSISLVEALVSLSDEFIIPDFLPELARLEEIYQKVKRREVEIRPETNRTIINPSLEVFQSRWKLADLFNTNSRHRLSFPQKGEEWILIWHHPEKERVFVKAAGERDLMALKIIADEIPMDQVVQKCELTIGQTYTILRAAVAKHILIDPPPRIRRNANLYSIHDCGRDDCLVASTFTLQWHITNVCDLHCRHCYDRSNQQPLALKQNIEILDDFLCFCQKRNVSGHICFTGGNPFLYPNFFKLYESACERGFSISILGNPVAREKMEGISTIKRPKYFQVSLEGLPKHNDSIRGRGHFAKTIEFLGVLRDLDIGSGVMLTLTKENMSQILPLAERLRGHTKSFTFSRLSLVGEGKNLRLPEKEEYSKFLEDYVNAAAHNPILRFKDNLINIVLHQKGLKTFGGCTGYGCGAAFNFIVVLPRGEVHACRKFPSQIGNVLRQNIDSIYDSETAEKYRRRSSDCYDCQLFSVCGGCLAISKSYGLDVFKKRDPFCFMNRER